MGNRSTIDKAGTGERTEVQHGLVTTLICSLTSRSCGGARPPLQHGVRDFLGALLRPPQAAAEFLGELLRTMLWSFTVQLPWSFKVHGVLEYTEYEFDNKRSHFV